jgi:hypothetical protein
VLDLACLDEFAHRCHLQQQQQQQQQREHAVVKRNANSKLFADRDLHFTVD